ncbi:dihydroxy-acid dehydratase [Halomonas kalidii]|uniref:Dihydroxy-acid dehydratase n=1 Tax=Halomonas kalidii TaxID=3043293 RepID=A0ABT6VEQ8_9GAMM|nr:dihydroxy-acid dehydratase [Halomonas kalidii]MDI5932476.1 dihydroxy-acid dehydratase [Halomonas kalidii]
MKKRLRSLFEPGSSRWAVRRAQWLAMGLSERDLLKPKIAVVNSSSKLSVCYQHLDAISEQVQEAIRVAGGVPFEIHTTAPSDFITSAGRKGRYLMPSRDLLVNDVEAQVEGAMLDGMVLLASCDKTTPGQLMAAARLDIPSIVVPCGYQLGSACGGASRGEATVDIEDVYKAVGSVKAGSLSLDGLQQMTCQAIRGPGVCAGLATANSMHMMAEALGMALPGSAPIRANSERQQALAREAGIQILQLIEEDLTPRQILSPSAFRNALRVAVTTGTSVNTIRHLIAVAVEAECPVDILAELESLQHLPQITQVRPNGLARIEDLEHAGGCRGVMSRLGARLEGDALTVTIRTVAENVSDAPEPDEQVIRSLDQPFRSEPGLILVRGNLAPDGAIVKLSAVPPAVRRFEGPARVFEDEDEAINGLENGGVRPGDVVILRMLGPKGGPGTVFAASFMAALVGAGLGETVAVITDGELSGLNSGITIGQVMPEAAEGGPLAVVRNDDRVTIDLTARTLALELDEQEVAGRLQDWQPREQTLKPGWLSFYGQLVQPLSRGAVLGRRPEFAPGKSKG